MDKKNIFRKALLVLLTCSIGIFATACGQRMPLPHPSNDVEDTSAY